MHVKDLGDLYLRLAEAALQEKDELFGNEAYYFAEDGEHIWKDVSKMVATEGKKLGAWETAEVKSLSVEEIDAVEPRGSYLVSCCSVIDIGRHGYQSGYLFSLSSPLTFDTPSSPVLPVHLY